MNLQLQKLYSDIETQREKLLDSLKASSNEKLNRNPPNKWSINQVIAHLITVERLSVQYLNKKILGVKEAKDTGLMEELKMLLLIASQRMPLKFKAPKVVVEQTITDTDLNRLIEEWKTTRAALKNILQHLEDRHLKRKIYKHVRLGMMNVQHALIFFREHVSHHTPQVKYLLKQK